MTVRTCQERVWRRVEEVINNVFIRTMLLHRRFLSHNSVVNINRYLDILKTKL